MPYPQSTIQQIAGAPEEYKVCDYPGFCHLGENRPVQDEVPRQPYPRASDNEMRQGEGSVRAQTSDFENCPQDNQFNYNQKMVSKSSRFEKHGSVEYGPKQQSHPIMD